jgi:catechol 1,2-dioxygenase
VHGNFALIDFDFTLSRERDDVPTTEVIRARAVS